MYKTDKRIVMTLDAGGTNFAFSAIQGDKEIIDVFSLPAYPHDLSKCMETIVSGFKEVQKQIETQKSGTIVAISFAFPGPADYKNGIIGDLPNFPSFRGGIALGPYLAEIFKIPVFINNDGNLFALGESIAGALPIINKELLDSGCKARYKNLIGVTFGTGFGAGVVINNDLLLGDNGCGGDIWAFRNKIHPNMISEESVSIRGVVREYCRLSNNTSSNITPKQIFDIAEGNAEGNRNAAIKAFEIMGEVAGDAIAHMLTVVDGIIVIGGGIANAHKYIIPAIKKEMQSKFNTHSGGSFDRLQIQVYDLTNSLERKSFFQDKSEKIRIINSDKEVDYFSAKQTAIAVSTLGTSRAVSLGAYFYALSELDKIAIQQ